MEPIVITGYARTPIGNLLGSLNSFTATDLASYTIQACIHRSQLLPQDIDEVILGCVLPAGQGQAPARQASIKAGLPNTVPCTTINKVCGSGMKATMFAHDLIQVGNANIMVVGGMESMSNAPYLLDKARQGYRLGHQTTYDHMLLDGLEDAYDKGQSMGVFAEECVKQFGFTRKQQDDYALSSFERAQYAINENLNLNEIIALNFTDKKGEHTITQDERPFSVKPERIPSLSPAFAKDGTVTAGNSSSIADGAASLVLMRESEAKRRNLSVQAKIIGHCTVAKAPREFTTAPIDACKKLLEKLQWDIDSVDLFEVNEAFAVVALAFMHELRIPREKVNIYGGACALGHPIGASGARILVTLINALQQNKYRRGIATLCIGGGEATAIAIEIPE